VLNKCVHHQFSTKCSTFGVIISSAQRFLHDVKSSVLHKDFYMMLNHQFCTKISSRCFIISSAQRFPQVVKLPFLLKDARRWFHHQFCTKSSASGHIMSSAQSAPLVVYHQFCTKCTTCGLSSVLHKVFCEWSNYQPEQRVILFYFIIVSSQGVLPAAFLRLC